VSPISWIILIVFLVIVAKTPALSLLLGFIKLVFACALLFFCAALLLGLWS
jgi:hypothetical protein